MNEVIWNYEYGLWLNVKQYNLDDKFEIRFQCPVRNEVSLNLNSRIITLRGKYEYGKQSWFYLDVDQTIDYSYSPGSTFRGESY